MSDIRLIDVDKLKRNLKGYLNNIGTNVTNNYVVNYGCLLAELNRATVKPDVSDWEEDIKRITDVDALGGIDFLQDSLPEFCKLYPKMVDELISRVSKAVQEAVAKERREVEDAMEHHVKHAREEYKESISQSHHTLKAILGWEMHF